MICFGCWPLVAKRTCIKGGFHDFHALFNIVVHNVHVRCLIKCLLSIFLLIWTLMSTMSCIGLYLVSSSQHVMFTLCFVALCFVLGLSFIFSFILHPSCIIIIVCSFISCLCFSLTLCLFITKRERVYSRKYTRQFLSFLHGSCAHPKGEKFYFACTFIEGEIFHRGDAYTKGEKTLY